MERLSKAGLLYLKEYIILNQAKKDMDEFLNTVVDQVYSELRNIKDSIDIPGFKLGVYQNNSSRGHLGLSLTTKDELSGFRKGKVDIEVIYDDIRCNSNITDPLTASVLVWAPSVLSGLRRELTVISKKLLNKDVYERTLIKLNVENASDSVEKIVSCIMEKCNELKIVVSEYARE